MTLDKTFLRRSGNPDVYSVKEDDVQLIQAIEKAKHTLKYFKDSLENPKPQQTYFSIKTKLTDGNHVEHIWLDAAEISDKIVYGIVNNVPTNLKNIELGTKIGVSEDEITDWLIVENNRLIGGYTIRAIREKMSRVHRELFESTINFKIDHGADYFEANNTTPEGAVLLLENAYDSRELQSVYNLIDFEHEASFILKQRMPKFDGNPELIQQFVELLKVSLEKELVEKRWPTFKNVERAFTKKETVSDDIMILTEQLSLNGSAYATNKLFVKKRADNTYIVAGNAK
jgi:uncharacterized protein YegJ (DUF2314 family)